MSKRAPKFSLERKKKALDQANYLYRSTHTQPDGGRRGRRGRKSGKKSVGSLSQK